jgi:DNA-binding beta-propeller fold protein YncE
MRVRWLVWLLFGPACSQMDTPAMKPGDPPGFSSQGFHLTVIASDKDGLQQPSGLAFPPDHPDQLWVVNRATNGVVILFDPGTPTQRAETRIDAFAQHFMAKPTSIAFGTDNHFATCQDSRDEWNEHPITPDDFMGPTLWDASLDIFAAVNQTWPKPAGGLEGSHIDMLHESPWCMGIAHDHDNVFWAFDGLHGHIVRYDFVQDHGPGGSKHSDGRVRRFMGATVHRREAVPSALAFDQRDKMLYVADTSADQVMRLDTGSGVVANIEQPQQMETLAEYKQVMAADWKPVVTSLGAPSAMVLTDDRIYVYSGGCGQIVSFDRNGTELARMAVDSLGVTGMTIGPDGKLYFTDGQKHTVTRVDP